MPLLIYDSECRLCVATKQRLERAVAGTGRRRVRFVPYRSDEARHALGAQYSAGCPEMAFFVEPSGEVRCGLDAFLPLIPDAPGGRIVLRLLRLPFGTAIAAWAYRQVARYRYRLFGAAGHPQDHAQP